MELKDEIKSKESNGATKHDFDHKIDFESTLSFTKRAGNNSLKVDKLSYEVDEHGMEWWQKLASLQIPWKKADGEVKQIRILKNLSFQLKSGQMLAVLGSSGSGKTTLLDVISSQTNAGSTTGNCYINDKRITPSVMKSCSAYVRQDDRLLSHLTVKETLMFIAELKLPKSWSMKQKKDRVNSVIDELGLRHVKNGKIGGAEIRGISGGERRRVSIAIQLLLDPDIIFLDEPTSGLDAFTAHHLMETLAKLAQNNRIVMLTIHQPRSDIFELFDVMMLLSKGEMVYYGNADDLIPYFTELGHPCLPLTNPCDFYVDLITINRKSDEAELETEERVSEFVRHFSSRESLLNVASGIEFVEESANFQNGDFTYLNGSYVPDGDEVSPKKEIQDCIQSTASHDSLSSKPTAFKQFSVLIRRAFANNMEDYSFLGVQAIEAICMSLMIGLIYYQLGLDQIGLRDRFGLLYMVMALYPYMVILDVIGQCQREKNVLYFEMMDGIYTAYPYYLSKIISDIPEHTVFVVLYAVPGYFMTGLSSDPGAFLRYFVIVYTLVLCSRMLGYLAAALFPAYQISVLFAQTVYTFSLLSCGFIFNLDNIFVGVRWTKYISYLKWGFQSLCIIEFRGQNFTCDVPPTQQDICLWTGEEALEFYSLNDSEVWIGFLAIATIASVFNGLYFIVLKYVPQKPHEQ